MTIDQSAPEKRAMTYKYATSFSRHHYVLRQPHTPLFMATWLLAGPFNIVACLTLLVFILGKVDLGLATASAIYVSVQCAIGAFLTLIMIRIKPYPVRPLLTSLTVGAVVMFVVVPLTRLVLHPSLLSEVDLQTFILMYIMLGFTVGAGIWVPAALWCALIIRLIALRRVPAR